MSGANMRGMRAHVRNVLPCRHAYIGLRALQRMSKAMSNTTCGNLILVAAVATVGAVVDDVVAVVIGGNAPDLGQPIGLGGPSATLQPPAQNRLMCIHASAKCSHH